MNTDKSAETIKLFEFGVEGGGSSVFKLPDNTVVERGDSGGFLDEEEDPHRSWEKVFDSWETWWRQFINKHQSSWICFYPIFMDEQVKPLIKESLQHIISGNRKDVDVKNWERLISETNKRSRKM